MFSLCLTPYALCLQSLLLAEPFNFDPTQRSRFPGPYPISVGEGHLGTKPAEYCYYWH